ncbi:MAG: zinc-ribbon domain-containing protein [Chloroflexota bacterium]
MFCLKCGSKLPEGSRFCPRCGATAPEPGVISAKKVTRPASMQKVAAPRRWPAIKIVAIPKLVKTIIFVALLVAATSYLGNTSRQIGQAGNALLSFSPDSLLMFVWLLLALVLVATTAGLLAVLVCPLWVCFVAFAAASLAWLFICGLNLINLVLALLFFLAGFLYSRGVARGLREHITFTMHPIKDSQPLLFIVLMIAISVGEYHPRGSSGAWGRKCRGQSWWVSTIL